METKYPSITVAAITAMRDTNFTGGRIGSSRGDGNVTFIRCGRSLKPGEAAMLARNIREATGDSDDQVTSAHNPDYAQHEYLRISTDSKAYAFICHLKS